MKMFIRVTDAQYGDENIINLDNISLIHEGSRTIVLNGVHGCENGVIHVNKDDIEKIIKNISIVK